MSIDCDLHHKGSRAPKKKIRYNFHSVCEKYDSEIILNFDTLHGQKWVRVILGLSALLPHSTELEL